MNNQKLFMLVMLGLGSASVYAARERVIKVQNTARVGYNSNVYANEFDEQDSAYFTDILQISAKLNFSSRTDMLLYYQPELRYWLDVTGDDVVTYQDVYARLNHAVSQRTFLTVSDRFRYQQNDGQNAQDLNSFNNTYIENDLKGAVDYTINSVSQVKVGAAYKFRQWDDDNYGEWQAPAPGTLQGSGGNNFGQYTLDGSYVREFIPNKTKGLFGMSYTDLEYDGNRGGYNGTTVYGGVDHNFTPNLTAFSRVGWTFATTESSITSDSDSDSPFMQNGLEYNPTARTSFNASLGYSIQNTDNTAYNAVKDLNMGVGVRHDLTAKISLSSNFSYIYSQYDSDFASDVNTQAALQDEEVGYIRWNIRTSYQINRNNFVDAGYAYADRSTDKGILSEYNQSIFDLGWRLRF